jgi:phosphatidate cytidylyltransferase
MINPSSPSTNKWRDFPRRLITGLVGVPAVLLLVYVGGWATTVAIVVISLIAALEIARVIDRDNRRGLIFTLALALLGNALAIMELLWVFLAVVAVMGLAAYLMRRTQVLYFVLGAAYVAIPLSMLIRIRAPQDGLWWLLLLLLCVWGTDTFALIGGRLIGQRKLAPAIFAGQDGGGRNRRRGVWLFGRCVDLGTESFPMGAGYATTAAVACAASVGHERVASVAGHRRRSV